MARPKVVHESYREKSLKLAPDWAKDLPTRIITALDWRYWAKEFVDMSKEEVIADMQKVPFERSSNFNMGAHKQVCEFLDIQYPPTKNSLGAKENNVFGNFQIQQYSGDFPDRLRVVHNGKAYMLYINAKGRPFLKAE